MNTPWIPVVSSNIEALNFGTHGLGVRFKGGTVYQYPRVPKETYEALMTAPSVGSAFHQLIKNKFEFSKLPQ